MDTKVASLCTTEIPSKINETMNCNCGCNDGSIANTRKLIWSTLTTFGSLNELQSTEQTSHKHFNNNR
jgi:hypothetical protein